MGLFGVVRESAILLASRTGKLALSLVEGALGCSADVGQVCFRFSGRVACPPKL